MTDMPYDDDDHAEDVVTAVFIRHMAKLAAKFLAKLLIFLILALGLRVFAVISLWHVPAWVVGFIGALFTADVTWRVARAVRKSQEHRKRKADRAHLTADQRHQLELEDMKARQAKFNRERHVRDRVRQPRWWANTAIVLTYTACFGLVIAHWTDNAAIGASAAVGLYVGGAILRNLLDRTVPDVTAANAFLDARGRPDTPEI